MSIRLKSISGTATILLLAAAVSLLFSLPLRAECPEGTTPVEDVTTGKGLCKREDVLRTEPAPKMPPRAPGEPLPPPFPPEPGEPVEPEAAPPGALSPSECTISLIGCEEECRRTYLTEAQGIEPGTAARAAERLKACLRVCREEHPCP